MECLCGDHASQDDAGLQMLQAMCQEAAAAAAEQEQAGSVAAGGTIHVGKGPAGASLGDCHSKIFHPVTGLRCKHIYRHTVKGMSTHCRGPEFGTLCSSMQHHCAELK
jgi:hypothetical protein